MPDTVPSTLATLSPFIFPRIPTFPDEEVCSGRAREQWALASRLSDFKAQAGNPLITASEAMWKGRWGRVWGRPLWHPGDPQWVSPAAKLRFRAPCHPGMWVGGTLAGWWGWLLPQSPLTHGEALGDLPVHLGEVEPDTLCSERWWITCLVSQLS